LNFKGAHPQWRIVDPGTGYKFLERYHHSVNLCNNLIIFYGGRRADHTPCLFLEEGNRVGKNQQNFGEIERVVLSDQWSPDLINQWISSIYTGTKPEKNTELSTFFQQHQEKIVSHMLGNITQALTTIALEGKYGNKSSHSDLTIHLTDGAITAHRILLISNPLISCLIPPEQLLHSTEITFNISLSSFSAIKQWLYTGDLGSSTDKLEILSSVAHYGESSPLVQQCILSVIDSISNLNAIKILELALKNNLEMLRQWMEWYIAVNYSSFKLEMKKLPDEVLRRVVKNEWPGPKYKEKYSEWKRIRDENDRLNDESSGSNCIIQ